MDLFAQQAEREQESTAPLAYRMRPQTLNDVVGQQDIVGPNSLLRRAIEADRLMSVIFYGPPGTGKTTLAQIIANVTKARFESINAVSAGVADIRRVVETAKDERNLYGRRTVLFVDEIHRFSKSQQDALLPYVEAGTVVLIGATTENPYHEVNGALVSRSHIFRLRPLTAEDIGVLLHRALADKTRGLGRHQASLLPAAEDVFVRFSSGDARRAFNALELAVLSCPVTADGTVVIDAEQALASVQERQVLYDKSGDEHYDTISAFIKSVRGSDADAALFWLAKMLVAGEDPLFIARRLVISASEDIGNADAQGLSVAVAALHTVQAIGMPEGRIALAQATTYLASAPKSNAAYAGLNQAMADVQAGVSLVVPTHLKSGGYSGAVKLGNGVGYLYPHDYPGHFVEQDYWPAGVKPRHYYVSESAPHDGNS